MIERWLQHTSVRHVMLVCMLAAGGALQRLLGPKGSWGSKLQLGGCPAAGSAGGGCVCAHPCRAWLEDLHHLLYTLDGSPAGK
jgi:hypothetical protein